MREAARFLSPIKTCNDLEAVRERLRREVETAFLGAFGAEAAPPSHELIRVRDCAYALLSALSPRSDRRSGFSVAQALWDLAAGRARPDLQPGFFAEIVQWFRGMEGRADFRFAAALCDDVGLEGREAAVGRSDALDGLWESVQDQMRRYRDGMCDESAAVRNLRKRRIMKVLGASEEDWTDWKWQTSHIIKSVKDLASVVQLSEAERRNIERAEAGRLPFGVTPYYASLMDDDPDSGNDRALRAQVIPQAEYVDHMLAHKKDRRHSCDFMLESETSPVDLITRRYPGIVILKPINTCPQVCVYCQRNWEIEEAMSPDALASDDRVDAAIQWIAERPAIKEVLITGGDPFVLEDRWFEKMLTRLSAVDHVDLIRIGTRTPVTLPMRITGRLADLLGGFRQTGRRDVAIVTHIEHPYEVTLETARAVDCLRRAGLCVYNQQVYTFYVSRRFETALLRFLLRRIGIDPYYTFAPKGKEETGAFRVPLARMLQEQKEEARLMPGLRRTDEAVFNIPGLGKNYLRALQHRDLLTVLPDGARVYEFHPWEKNVVQHSTYLYTDVPILDYLSRLAKIGEDVDEYSSIWFYY